MTTRAGVVLLDSVLLYLLLRFLTAMGLLEYRVAHHAGLRAEGCMWRGKVYLLEIDNVEPTE